MIYISVCMGMYISTSLKIVFFNKQNKHKMTLLYLLLWKLDLHVLLIEHHLPLCAGSAAVGGHVDVADDTAPSVWSVPARLYPSSLWLLPLPWWPLHLSIHAIVYAHQPPDEALPPCLLVTPPLSVAFAGAFAYTP